MTGEPQTTAPPASFVERRDWESTRCRSCARMLCKHTQSAVRAGQMIEIKCSGCNALNYIVGPVET